MPTLLWFLWSFGLMAIALSTRNPLYLVLLLLVACIVREAVRTPSQRGISILRFALIAIPLSAIFNAISVHFGDTVLFVVPGDLPVFSGPVTLEALAYGAINGLMLTTVLAAFSTLSLAVAPREWMRLAPRAYQSVGLTMSIAMGFAPQVMARLREVRDAQAIRGHRVRGLRDWLPLWMPLLTGSLEQSMQMSEAMVARGYGATHSQATSARAQGLLLAGLALGLLGWVMQLLVVNGWWLGTGLLVAGGVLLFAAMRLSAGNAPHTAYRQQRWQARDVVIALMLTATCTGVLIAPALGIAPSLTYTPYPALTAPSFDVWIGVALLAFLAPLLRRG
jgi:energy-coupling factor transport system permease protein